jgi:hypothetical protein
MVDQRLHGSVDHDGIGGDRETGRDPDRHIGPGIVDDRCGGVGLDRTRGPSLRPGSIVGFAVRHPRRLVVRSRERIERSRGARRDRWLRDRETLAFPEQDLGGLGESRRWAHPRGRGDQSHPGQR